MSIKDKILNIFKKTKETSPPGGPLLSSITTNIFSNFGGTDRPYHQLVDHYVSWVYTCIDKIAKSVAMIPLNLYVYRRDGKKITDLSWRPQYRMASIEEKRYILKQLNLQKELITDHPVLDLLRKPNSIMTRFLLWYETMVRLELSGKCGWYMPPNKLGLPQEIYPLPLTKYATLKPKINSFANIEYWIYMDTNIEKKIPPQDLLFIHYPHPASPFEGMSPLLAQTYPYDIDLFMMQQQRSLLENQAIPGLTITTDQKLTKAQVKEIKELIEEQYRGPLKAGDTAIFHSGFKPERLSFSSRDLMIDEIARYTREKIISAYDLSEGKLGIVRDVNRANMEALNTTFLNECLKPKCMLIEEIIETFLLPRYDEGLTCDFELPDTEDKESKLKEREINIRTYFTTINEERAKEGLPPVPWGDRPWAPFNLMQLGESVARIPGETLNPEEEEGEEEETGKIILRPDWAIQ